MNCLQTSLSQDRATRDIREQNTDTNLEKVDGRRRQRR